jgi:hypothetical protein
MGSGSFFSFDLAPNGSLAFRGILSYLQNRLFRLLPQKPIATCARAWVLIAIPGLYLLVKIIYNYFQVGIESKATVLVRFLKSSKSHIAYAARYHDM